MSPREEVQRKLVEFLEGTGYFTAPYGILEGMTSMGKGKARTVTFGVARYLDATATIFSPARISVRGQGGLASRFEGEFKGLDELVKHFREAIK
jgi:hypothetical protein